VPADSLTLNGFTVFEDTTLDFASGVNVIIGANGTGKTHLMKVLYTLLRSFEQPQRQAELLHTIEGKLAGVFRPDDARVGRLVRRVRGKGVAEVSARVDGSTYGFSLHQTAGVPVRGLKGSRAPQTPTSIFVPSREVLAMFEGFAALYAARELSIDETYADLVQALDLPPLKGARPGAIGQAARELEIAIGARVSRKGPRFYLREARTGAKVEASLAAEGHRKVASILQLISNGSLRDRAVMFWDEPEANLNPALAETVVDAITSLAHAGVQVVLATHDYLIADRISLAADLPDAPATRFFAMKRDKGGAAVAESADRLSDLDTNLLIDAIREHSQFQRQTKLRRLNP
jgi:energy-coupling factor transporter ATP-binding protein EcfA2